MAFIEQPVKPFTRESVLSIDPGQLGVYGIFKAGQWIYVGKGDIRARLLDHLGGDIPCIITNGATSWVAEVHPNRDEREKELIRDLSPTCNRRVG